MTISGPGRLRTGGILAYAAPAFAFAMPTLPIYIYLPALYADKLGLGLALTGAVMLAARCFDAVTDPVAGLLSDRTRSRYGARKPWILGGSVIAAIGLIMLVFPFVEPGAFYLLIALVVLYSGWSAVMVPYTAWAAELSEDYDERARITAWREAAGLVGILAAALIPVAVLAQGGDEAGGLQAVALVAVATGAVGLVAMARMTPNATSVIAERSSGFDVKRSVALLRRNKPFLRLATGWFVNGLANGIPAALFLLYLEYALAADGTTRGLFILVYFLCAVAAMPLWTRLSSAYGKHRAWCFAMILACAAFVCVPWIGPGGFVAFFIVCAITGAALGADLSLPPALQADVVDFHRLRSPTRDTGLFFAAWNLITKIALAVAAGAALVGVDLLGFDPKAPDDDGRLALVIVYALVPVALKLGAIALIWGFPIDRRRQALIARRLRSERSGGERASEVLQAEERPVGV
ncbi:MAG: MFS transporter [Pseudomonadota bacterium]